MIFFASCALVVLISFFVYKKWNDVSVRSVTVQSLSYFAQPSTPGAVPTVEQLTRLKGNWRGDQLDEQDWMHRLSSTEISEFNELARKLSKDSKKLSSLRKRVDPCLLGPRLTQLIETSWKPAVQDDGRGFQVTRGLPVSRWTEEETAAVFWCVGLHFGMGGAQNNDGDLLGHVKAEPGVDAASVRLYRTDASIDYHCDAADLVGLFCLEKAADGRGASKIASTVHVFSEIVRSGDTDLVEFLLQGHHYLDTRGSGGVQFIAVKPVSWSASEGILRSNHHSEYYNTSRRHRLTPKFSDVQERALQVYKNILARPGVALSMDLEPGDIQLVNNHLLVHSRDGYTDDPVRPRHLLRLWLSHGPDSSSGKPWQATFERALGIMSILYRLGSQKIKEKFS